MHDAQAQFPPGYEDQFQRRVDAGPAATTVPLPGPLMDAWLPESLTAAGLKLRPVVASDWAVIQRIESPLLAELAGLAASRMDVEKPEVRYTDEQIWELVYLWTHTPREVRAALAPGLPHWREVVMQSTADQLPGGVVAERGKILTALAANVMRSLSTSVSYAGPKGPEGEQVFTPPPPRTASVGG